MSKLRMFALAGTAAMAAAVLAPFAPAQDKPPPIESKQVKKDTFADLLKGYQQGTGSYRFVSGDETLTSGDFVAISRKGNNERLSGVFVYADAKSGKLFIRPKAGQPPIGVLSRDVDKIERIRPAVGTPDKGGVRPAIETGEKASAGYEIHTMTVHNGTNTTMFFYETSLSGAERDQLSAMEKAGNDLVQKGNSVESLRQALETAANTPPTTVVETSNGGNGYPGYAYPYYYPVAYYNMYWVAYGGPLPATVNYPFYPASYMGYPGNGGGGGNTTVVVQNTGSNGQGIAELTKSLGEAQAALVEARKTYVATTNRAIVDPNGRIVAVRLEE
jgi:hypothetical protein